MKAHAKLKGKPGKPHLIIIKTNFMFFLHYLEQLTFAAHYYIFNEVSQQKEIILFDENDDWDTISDTVPVFPHCNKYDYVQYAAIRSLRYTDDNVEITGILKGDDHPNESVITLSDLSVEHSIQLADYLAGIQPHCPEGQNTGEQVFYLTVKIVAASRVSADQARTQFTTETNYLFTSTEDVQVLDTEIIEARTTIE